MGTCYYLDNFPVCLKLFQNEKFKVPDMFYEHMSTENLIKVME